MTSLGGKTLAESMAGSKILVFGATGPSGINVLRELIHRKQDAVLYARTPSKIPADITESRYIEVGPTATP